MKFPKVSFGHDWNELKKFELLKPEERSIVFYGENTASMGHFKPIINELTNNFGKEICYVASDPNDPILKTQNNKIKTFYIGQGTARTKFFITLKADILVMDMPDLETFHIKRSKVYPVHYVYVFHSIFSVHSYLRKGAIDHFDTIFCVGPHHIKEIRETESVYGLKEKNLVEYGYGRLDTLMEEYSQIRQQNIPNEKIHVLIAPSYGVDNVLANCGLEMIKILLDSGFQVTTRPHPVTLQKSPAIIKKIEEAFIKNPNFILERDISSYGSFRHSDCMISDWSGVSLEYAFSLERPVIFIDVPKKVNNPNVDDIQSKPIEIDIRNKIGTVIPPIQLHVIPEKIKSLLQNFNDLKKQIQEIREQTVFNIGNAGKVGAIHLLQILEKNKK